MTDLTFNSGTFDATEITVTATTDAGRNLLGQMFGAGAVSFTLPKSRGADFAAFAVRKGLRIA